MSTTLRILHLEDDPLDSERVRKLLARDGLAARIDRVITLEEFQQALGQEAYALALVDYAVPGVEPLEALSLARRLRPELPFIFLSGTIGEEVAIETLKLGATDYVLKQRLDRLVPAMRRALQEAEEQDRRRQAEATLRQSEERFRAFFELAAVGMAQTELAGNRFVAMNDRYCQITGYSREELLRMSPADLTHPEDRARDSESLARLVRGEVPEYMMEKRYLRKGGAVVWIQLSVTCERDALGRPLRSVAIIQDITERRRAEEALREADRRKDEFLAMLAHELRNPLAPVRYAVQMLNMVSTKEPFLQRQRDIIDRQVSHMARLLDDLLDVSRITRGKIQIKKERMDLREAVMQAVEASQPAASARRHELKLHLPEEPLWLEGDLVRLTQVVGNLLGNAIKYTDESGRIEVSLAREEARNPWERPMTVVRVRDNGIGIGPELLPHVFELFRQAERPLDRTQGGLGIGLTLVQSLVQQHGGTVEAHSDGLGHGSEFIIRLPLLADPAPAQQGAASEPGRAGRPQHACRVLIIEDNQDSADSLRDLLELMGHPVQVAYDGPRGLAIAPEFQPEIILLDIGLPGMSGYEVARRIKSDPRLESALLVALTGYGQDEDRQRTAEAGFDAHYTKPVEADVLRQLLGQACDPDECS